MKIIPNFVSKLNGKNAKKSPVVKNEKPGMFELNMVFFIVEWAVFKIVLSVFEEVKVPLYLINKGRGTATSEILDLLGIGASEKAVISCLEQPVKTPALLKEVRKKLGALSPGAGIAFTIPLSAINSPVLRAFKQIEGSKTGDGHSGDFPHALIYSVVNKGHSDEFMNTARKAGALGGTVMNARGQTHDGAVRFFGISVQEEREIILILTSREKKEPILRAVSGAHGLDSKAQGLTFSMPVDMAVRLNFEQELNT